MNKNEFSLRNLFLSLWHHLPVILIAVVIFGAATWAVTTFLITPTYTATAKMIAISNRDRTNDYYTISEHNAAVELVKTTAEVIKTDKILVPVSERLANEYGLNYSPMKLRSMISITSDNETEVFSIKVSGPYRNTLPILVNVIAQETEANLITITGAGTATILQESDSAGKTGPSVIRNTVLGALIGFVLAALFVILRDINDTTIWTEDDLTSRYDIPVLGLIPQLNLNEPSGKAKE